MPGDARAEYAGRHTLLVGSGYSAATNVVALAGIAAETSDTRITWVTRRNRDVPIPLIDNDPLIDRKNLTATANDLATRAGGPVDWLAGHSVTALTPADNDDGFQVTVRSQEGGTEKTLDVDRIIANVGFRPDRSIYEELQVQECYASQGPLRLAAKLLGESSTDCLIQPTPDGRPAEPSRTGLLHSRLEELRPKLPLPDAGRSAADSRCPVAAPFQSGNELMRLLTISDAKDGNAS